MAADEHTDIDRAARLVLGRAADHLLSLQAEQGWWKGDLETNVTMNAEDILLRHFLGLEDRELIEATARWIRSRQLSDGCWNTFYGGPPDLSTTVEAYVALRIAGDHPDAEHMQPAAAWIRRQGGIARTRVFTRIWLALFGWWDWDRLPELPPEINLLPRWSPIGVYSLASWARGSVVALSIVSAFRPVRRSTIDLTELHPETTQRSFVPSRTPAGIWERVFAGLDRILHGYRRWAIRPLRRLAVRRAAAWILARQEADGCWAGIQPPTVYSIIALHLTGYWVDHPVIAQALASLESYSVRRDDHRMVEACQSPVWDTALAVIALTDAGIRPDHPRLVRAADWLLDQQVSTRGDWAVRRPKTPAGGWAYEFHNEHYPDTDDSAMVMLALRRVRGADPARRDAAMRRGIGWLWAMQSASGAWAAFDVDNTRAVLTKAPFCDFGEVIDPPSADVTAHVVELLVDTGHAEAPRTRRAVRWLLDEQQPDGSWFGRWGTNYVFGTGAVVPALVAAGVPVGDASIRRAAHWIRAHQNRDGGWGEDIRSYRDRRWVGRGSSTASQTAWALLALLAAGDTGAAVQRGVDWLSRMQSDDGGWDEPQFTGTGFPGDFSINYHLYRLVWPITALGRYLDRCSVPEPADPVRRASRARPAHRGSPAGDPPIGGSARRAGHGR